MNVSTAPHVARVRRDWKRGGPALQTFARAWSSVSWRRWLIAAGIGVLIGGVYATFNFLYAYRGLAREVAAPSRVFLVMLTHWVFLMTGLACALAFVLALLRDIGKRAAIRPRDVALTILGVAAFGSLVVDPISLGPVVLVHSWLRLPPGPWEGVDWLTVLSRMYSNNGEKVFTVVGTVTLSALYYLKDSRTSDALAIAQLGLSRAQKRRLTEELRSAQAKLDPDFLLTTLAEVDRCFGGDPQVAQRLLDALIRYLRAALPAKDDTIGTLGQQAMLVRAYLEIEAVRSAGRMQGVIDVPGDLETRLFAPALILPLVALVCGDAAGSRRDTEILVRASVVAGRLTIEVRGNGSQPRPAAETETTLASLRPRRGALYGDRAELSFATRAPRGITSKIVMDDPGNL